MTDVLKLMCILAHPDDETLGMGGVLAKYAAEGLETYLVVASRGEQGWQNQEMATPKPDEIAQIRTAELKAAAEVLGIKEITFLDYQDGQVDEVDSDEAVAKIVAALRRVRPQVVVTFGPDGAYGHPDHIAISQYTTAAIVAAADTGYVGDGAAPHRVSKLYYRLETAEYLAAYEAAFGTIVMHVDGEERRAVGWPQWAINTRIETSDYSKQVWRAVQCHRSQLNGTQSIANFAETANDQIWERQTFYRVFSLVNGGRGVETDLFAGLRS